MQHNKWYAIYKNKVPGKYTGHAPNLNKEGGVREDFTEWVMAVH